MLAMEEKKQRILGYEAEDHELEEEDYRILGYDPDGMLPDYLGEEENAKYYLDLLSLFNYGKELDVFVCRFNELKKELIDNDITHLIYYGPDPDSDTFSDEYYLLAEQLEDLAEKYDIELVYALEEFDFLERSDIYLPQIDNDDELGPIEEYWKWYE